MARQELARFLRDLARRHFLLAHQGADDDQQVVFITADPGTSAARALREIGLRSAGLLRREQVEPQGAQ